MAKRALITGITGQDGSYLTELLLAKGYEVWGVIRRSSSFNTGRIDHLYMDPHEDPRLRLVHGDLNDSSSLATILQQVEPDEVYNLGAQSHVRVSFDIPEYTGEITGLGAIRLLEAIRRLGQHPRFYQASSSEMFGKVREVPQTETTPFHPRSPYACAKVYAHWQTVNYREAYGMHASSGILFNHECVSEHTPLLVRRDGALDVIAVKDLVPLRRKGPSSQHFEVPQLEVWDGQQWTTVRCITATRRRRLDPEHELHSIEARGGVVETTAHHRMIRADDSTCPAVEVAQGEQLKLFRDVPEAPGMTALTPEWAELLGLLCADGYVGESAGRLQFTNNDAALRERVAELWRRCTLGAAQVEIGPSGFDPSGAEWPDPVHQVYLEGGGSYRAWLREQLYTRDGFKRVPKLILNGDRELQERFLAGHYAGDGLKRGQGDSVKTNSAVLAQGLWWLYAAGGRPASVYIEHRGQRRYYTLNLPSANPQGAKGQHLRRDPAEVRKIVRGGECEWVFDLETESEVFMAGVGGVVIHNSPRRGETFVTRKITRAVARIKAGIQDKLYLGNLDAKRDWGYAGDYVEAMWLMLQQDEPSDYVIATGETHSVREFLEAAFGYLNLDYNDYVEIDPRYYRPAEVDLLIGDPSKAREKLGWEPKVTFDGLVKMMVDADVAMVNDEIHGTGHDRASTHGEVV